MHILELPDEVLVHTLQYNYLPYAIATCSELKKIEKRCIDYRKSLINKEVKGISYPLVYGYTQLADEAVEGGEYEKALFIYSQYKINYLEHIERVRDRHSGIVIRLIKKKRLCLSDNLIDYVSSYPLPIAKALIDNSSLSYMKSVAVSLSLIRSHDSEIALYIMKKEKLDINHIIRDVIYGDEDGSDDEDDHYRSCLSSLLEVIDEKDIDYRMVTRLMLGIGPSRAVTPLHHAPKVAPSYNRSVPLIDEHGNHTYCQETTKMTGMQCTNYAKHIHQDKYYCTLHLRSLKPRIPSVRDVKSATSDLIEDIDI